MSLLAPEQSLAAASGAPPVSSPPPPTLQLAERRAAFAHGAVAVGALFTCWSAANFARGTNDTAIYLWLLLLGSGLLCHFTQLDQRAHIIAFAVCAYSACTCLLLIFVGVAALFGNYFPCEAGACAATDGVCHSSSGVRVYPTCDDHYAHWSVARVRGYRVFCALGALASLGGLHKAGQLTRESWKASSTEATHMQAVG